MTNPSTVASGLRRTVTTPPEVAALISETLASAKAPCFTCSFQSEDVVLLHLLVEAKPDIPVLFLETFHHFAQTLAYRDRLTSE